MKSRQIINRTIYVLPLVLIAHLFCSHELFAQQQNQYSLYNLNPFQFNPAFAGSENSLVITGVYRSQWVNYPGQPVSQTLNAHMPLYITNGGIGVQFENTSIGAESKTSFGLSYSQFLPLKGEFRVALAASAEYYGLSLDGSLLRAPDGDYENGIDHLDNEIPNSSVNSSTLSISAGILIAYKGLRIGYSSKPFMENSVELLNNGQFSVDFGLNRHHYLYSTYFLDLSETVLFKPSILFRTDAVVSQMDIGLSAVIENMYHVGAAIRGIGGTNSESIGMHGGVDISRHLFIAYGYDLVVSDLNIVGTGSHEILLRYNFNRQIGAGTPARIIFNPRF